MQDLLNFTADLVHYLKPHTPQGNGIVERANKTMRESLVPVILIDYEQAKSEIAGLIDHYNNERKHSSLNYLMPIQYYMGDPDVFLAVRRAKMEKAKLLRMERNIEKRKGGESSEIFS